MRRRTFALTAFFLFALALAGARATAIRNGDYETRGTYQGVLYCADCPGIWTQVTLNDNGPNLGVGHGTFVMTERFTGGVHKGETIVSTGTWKISWDANMTSGLIALVVSGNPKRRYFQCEGGRDLLLANADGTIVPDQSMFLLSRVIPQRIPLFELTASQSNQTIYGRVGDRYTINLIPVPPPGTTPMPTPDFNAFSLMSVKQTPDIPEVLDLDGQDAIVNIVAANAGTARLTFRSRSKPMRTVTFDFEIIP